LVGYSGGGALAALLAERRGDVAGLVTVAADLDLDRWVRSLGLTPLRDSLDPATDAARLATTPQVHFIGGKDEVVDSDVLAAFLARQPPSAPAKSITAPGENHYCCWDRAWPALARRPELAAIPGWNGN
jgi:pimeloyl-ACP methyl ester carboxylesterase